MFVFPYPELSSMVNLEAACDCTEPLFIPPSCFPWVKVMIYQHCLWGLPNLWICNTPKSRDGMKLKGFMN